MTKLPEFMLSDFTYFYEFIVNFTKQNISNLNQNDCVEIYNQAIAILRSKGVITNPYHGA